MQVDGEKIRRARDAKLLTQTQAAELSGVSRGTVARLESGKGGGRPSSIKALARVYGVGPQELLPHREPVGV
jgi:transcriptional regulator with XRE-family HTH domain